MPRIRQRASVGWRHYGCHVRIVKAAELLADLRAVPASRPIPHEPPLLAAVLLAGVEVALVNPASDRSFRATWKRRQGGTATPLILIADAPDGEGKVQVLGPQQAETDLRTLDASDLSTLLHRLPALPRLEAIRQLAAELDRLDQRGIPGVRLQGLLTQHTLDHRVRHNAARWAELESAVENIPRGVDWRTALASLGYQVTRRPTPKIGFLARYNGQPVAVVHAMADPAGFARLDPEGRPPEGLLLNDCSSEGARFGLLASGSRIRLFDTGPAAGAATSRWIDLDAGSIRPDALGYLGLLGPNYLAEGGLDTLVNEARTYGTELRRRLDDTIRQRALPSLARGITRWADEHGLDTSDDGVRSELEQAALTLLFRTLFLLYCESAGYLPMAHTQYRAASITAQVEAAMDDDGKHDHQATTLWDQFGVVVNIMRTGKVPWGVPAYNGALFAADRFDGAATLERVSFRDDEWGPVLTGLGHDVDAGTGVDYSTLAIGHLGHIYEGLLSLRLSVADVDLAYDSKADRYVPAGGHDDIAVPAGTLLWQTNEGGRKGGGVYYTPQPLVAHLVRQAVAPAYEDHLTAVSETARTDPPHAAGQLFDFAVLDPACGSAHFLVEVVDHLADRLIRFLARQPLPGVAAAVDELRAGAAPGVALDDVALLRRLVLKHCVYGVDRSRMGAEIAKVSLWLASFVPGLSLAYRDRNVHIGNSLVGVVDTSPLAADGGALFSQAIDQALYDGKEAAARVALGTDRTPGEYEASAEADRRAVSATAGLATLCDVWTAGPFGVGEAKQQLLYAERMIAGDWPRDLVEQHVADQIEALRDLHGFLHWPVAFPGILGRDRPGFDVVVGNPPWNEITIERLAFYGLFRPGLRGLSSREREPAIADLVSKRPELEDRLTLLQNQAEVERRFFRASPDYPSMSGDPDLYKFFCLRYGALLRSRGRLGVVLPRSTFTTQGSQGFRTWLFEDTTCERIDLLENKARWAFDAEPRYTVALVAAERAEPPSDHRVRVAGVSKSLVQWEAKAASPGLSYAREAFGPGWTVPLLGDQAEVDLLAKVRVGTPFAVGGRRWSCFPVAELHETNDKGFWEGQRSGRPLWKGESFDQYDPNGAEARMCPASSEVLKKVRKPRPGGESLLGTAPLAIRQAAVRAEEGHPRVAFRDVSRATDSRTVRAALVPGDIFLTNTAPYLAFIDGDWPARLACLGVLNSLPFDWQARRFVETHMNFFILEGLVVPKLDEAAAAKLAELATRLSCVDERYAEVAEAMGLNLEPLPPQKRLLLRAEADGIVIRAWGLTRADVEALLADFTLDAVPVEHRRLLLDQVG
jgi:hypothetical protein